MTDATAIEQRPAKRGRRGIGRPGSAGQSVGRDLLIDVTCELLKTTQPAAISRALVARETKVDPSLIRYYFRNREALLIAAAERLTDLYAEMVDAGNARSDGSAESLLRERVAALVELNATYPFFHRLIVEEIMPSNDPAARALFGAVTERGSTSYDAILRAGVEAGGFRDVDRNLLFGAIIGLSEFYLSAKRVIEVARGFELPDAEMRGIYTGFICDLILNGIKRHEAPPAQAGR